MQLTLTSPVEGKQPGESATVTADRGNWLLLHGYAVKSGGNDEDFGRTATSVPASKDPTLAENQSTPAPEPEPEPEPDPEPEG